MEEKIQQLLKLVGSSWVFAFTLVLFTAETGWLALTSRFPMAFDESYHLSLIEFFSHRLNPIVTSQAANTYGVGAVVQNPSFLYHYLLSFPYRFIELFTHSLEVEAVSMRFINVAFALASLVVMRKLLRLVKISDAPANLIMLVFALTPIVIALSAQTNYDNLLILMTTLCIYQTIAFTQKLDRKIFDAKSLLTLICLCLFSSLVKFTFVPVFLAITAVVVWKMASYKPPKRANLISEAKRSFAAIGKYSKAALLAIGILGSFLFIRFYGVNLVKYHNPAPQCSQVLSVKACLQYYPWHNNYNLRQQEEAHPTTNKWSTVKYTTDWLFINGYGLFGELLPLAGPYYLSPMFCLIVLVILSIALVCTLVNFKKILQDNKSLPALAAVSLIYTLFIWGRNYHDYLRLGIPVAIDARYLIPVLLYFYLIMALGVIYAFEGKHKPQLIGKLCLVVLTVFSFVYYGGFTQYIQHITPIDGHIRPSDNFLLIKDTAKN
jgi:hypothetical protein